MIIFNCVKIDKVEEEIITQDNFGVLSWMKRYDVSAIRLVEPCKHLTYIERYYRIEFFVYDVWIGVFSLNDPEYHMYKKIQLIYQQIGDKERLTYKLSFAYLQEYEDEGNGGIIIQNFDMSSSYNNYVKDLFDSTFIRKIKELKFTTTVNDNYCIL